jgi:Zn-dependent peptidase ImmA (M78 family)
MMEVSFMKEIESHTLSLLSNFKAPPIPVNAIATSLGLDIEREGLGEEISGLLVVGNGGGVIGVNREHPLVRQRFSIAHEIGHFVLHREQVQLFIDKTYKAFFRDGKSARGTNKMEREANAFAAALLMPSGLIRRAAKSYEFELGDEGGPVDDLAELFQVSTQAMTYRLMNLGLFSKGEIGASA